MHQSHGVHDLLTFAVLHWAHRTPCSSILFAICITITFIITGIGRSMFSFTRGKALIRERRLGEGRKAFVFYSKEGKPAKKIPRLSLLFSARSRVKHCLFFFILFFSVGREFCLQSVLPPDSNMVRLRISHTAHHFFFFFFSFLPSWDICHGWGKAHYMIMILQKSSSRPARQGGRLEPKV